MIFPAHGFGVPERKEDWMAPHSATISDCGKYRYTLTRAWASEGKRVLYIMVNPSTADASIDDPTIRRCVNLAKQFTCWRFGSLEVVNLFAYRATKPKDMRALPTEEQMIGPENDRHIEEAVKRADLVIAAWGAHDWATERSVDVLNIVERAGKKLHKLALSKGGHPRHPLMLKCDAQPSPL